MILTAYLDESGTHDGSPTTVMAGIMGTAAQWARWEAALGKMQQNYGFKVFHSKRFKQARGEFAGWRPEAYRDFIDELGKISTNLTEAVTCTLTNAEYESYYKDENKPRRVRLDTKYGLCFRACANHFALEAMRRFGSHKKFNQTTLHVILESGHKNAGDAARVFNEFKNELRERGSNLLGTITFAGKDESNPLMVADYLAHGTLMSERQNPLRLIGDKPPPAAISRGTGVTELKFNPDALSSLKSELFSRVRSSTSSGRLGRAAPFVEQVP